MRILKKSGDRTGRVWKKSEDRIVRILKKSGDRTGRALKKEKWRQNWEGFEERKVETELGGL